MKYFFQILGICSICAVASSAFSLNFTYFSDITEENRPYSEYVSKKGFMNGYPDGTFQPQKNITRAEMAALLTRNKKDCTTDLQKQFPDVTKSDWTYAPLCKAFENKIITGFSDGTMQPHTNVTIAQASVMIQRVFAPDFHIENNCKEWWCNGLYFLQDYFAIPTEIENIFTPAPRILVAKMLFGVEFGLRSFKNANELYPNIVDSNVTLAQAMKGVAPNAPKHVLEKQRLLNVTYWGFDDRIHEGQVIMDERLIADIQGFFDLAWELKFPIEKVQPASFYNWDDFKIMEENNTSGFNWRLATDLDWISHHGYGFAFDINPVQNPYFREDVTYPKNAVYDPDIPGTLTRKHPLVIYMLKKGWHWGGEWRDLKDYHHFQKLLYEEKPNAH